MTELNDDGTKPRSISNKNEAIVALRGDGLFWISFQSVKVFEQEDKPKPRRGCENTGDGMVVAGLGCCPCYRRQQQHEYQLILPSAPKWAAMEKIR